MFNVYILRSINYPNEIYKGFTTLLVEQRLDVHNRGNVTHTSKYLPWRIVYTASFETKKLAMNFEKYLKTASGIAFMRKRLIEVPKKEVLKIKLPERISEKFKKLY